MALLLFYAFLFGAVMGAFYDLSIIIRALLGEKTEGRAVKRIQSIKLPVVNRAVTIKKHKILCTAVIFICDLLCILFMSAGIVALNYGYNSGEFRAFTAVGAVFGFFAYRFTLGRVIMIMSMPLAMLLKYIFLSFFIILGYPFSKIGMIIIKKVRKTIFLYSFTLEKKRKRVYNVDEEVYLLKMAETGFLSFEQGRK